MEDSGEKFKEPNLTGKQQDGRLLPGRQTADMDKSLVMEYINLI